MTPFVVVVAVSPDAKRVVLISGAGAQKYAPDFIEMVDMMMPFVQRVRAQATAAASFPHQETKSAAQAPRRM